MLQYIKKILENENLEVAKRISKYLERKGRIRYNPYDDTFEIFLKSMKKEDVKYLKLNLISGQNIGETNVFARIDGISLAFWLE